MTERPLDRALARVVLGALEGSDLTVDEFISNHGLYVNSWAPTFTRLLQAGYVKRTGERRMTTHKSPACVLTITRAGIRLLDQLDRIYQ